MVTDTQSIFWEENRLKTFINWPFGKNHKCSSDKMAEAGFYACGGLREPDLARCFFCDKELDGWEPDDDPWEEHKKHSPKCKFIVLGIKESERTVYQHIELFEEYAIVTLEKVYENELKTFGQRLEEMMLNFK